MTVYKQIALGAIIKLDDDGVGFDTVPGVISAQPPARTREEVEGRELGDDFEVPILGIEQASEFTITVHYKEDDTEHTKWTTLFESQEDCDIQIVTPHSTPITKEFTCKVKAIEEQEYAPNSTIRADIKVQRTSDITVT